MKIKIETLIALDLLLWASIAAAVAFYTDYDLAAWASFVAYSVILCGVAYNFRKARAIQFSLVTEEPDCPECGATDCGYYECGHPEFNEEEK